MSDSAPYILGTTLRFTITVHDPTTKQLRDPDGPPTAFVRINHVPTAQTVSIVSAGTSGVYDVSGGLAGLVEGDHVEVFVSILMDGIAYYKPYQFVVTAPERGTDGAYTGTPPNADAIATAVWSAGERTLSSFGNLIAEIVTAVWSAAERTLSAFAFIVKTDEESRNASKADISTLAKETTAEAARAAAASAATNSEDLPGMIVDGQFTASALANAPTGGGSGTTPAEVWSYGDRRLTGGNVSMLRSPLDVNDNLTLYPGTDYDPVIGSTITWSKDGYPSSVWGTGASGKFRFTDDAGAEREMGVVTLASDGDVLSATLVLTKVETDQLIISGLYELWVECADPAKTRILASGRLTVVPVQ